MVQPLHIKHAHVWDITTGAIERDLYTTDVVLDTPHPDAIEVDLDGYTIFPGLINAHDHLELNHYPRTKFREVYNNAHEWGEDVNRRLNDEPYKSLRAYPLKDRLFIGGLKNLLCGATTVAHHNPLHKWLKGNDFPVRVLQKYGWAHSLHFTPATEIQKSYRRTPKDIPWFIHLAEGTDETAKSEYAQLKALSCIDENTVIVHGVNMTPDDVDEAGPMIRGLVWCPSTNVYLLGRTQKIGSSSEPFWRGEDRHVAIGSDSRLTADGDLLDEIRFIALNGPYDADFIYQAITIRPAHILGLRDAGHLRTNAHADWLLCRSALFDGRGYLALVVKGGIPQIGDPDVMAKFPHIETIKATLDGVPKAIHIDLARRIQKCSLKESGLELVETPGKRFFLF